MDALGGDVVDDLTGNPIEIDDTSTFDELRRVKLLCMAAAEESIAGDAKGKARGEKKKA